MESQKLNTNKVTVEQIQDVMERILLPMPRAWLVVLSVATVLSLFEVVRNAEGTFVINFRLTTTTVLLVALIWLPFLLKVIAISGGGLKTAAGEASILGLDQLFSHLDPGAQRELLSSAVAAADVAEPKSPTIEQPKLRELRHDLEHQLASLPPKTQQAREQLESLANLYEATRKNMSSSSERTFKMSTIIAQAKALALQANYEPMEVSNLFAKDTDGSRIIALALLQAKPDSRFFALVLPAISGSRSAFEQYQALRAAEQMLPMLNSDEKQRLVTTLRDQRSGGPGKYITRDSDRRPLSDRILSALQ